MVLFLIFNFQSLSKANNINDLQIEGISIGDSLLRYSSEEEIINGMITDYNSKKYSRYTIRKINSKPLKKYDDIQVHFKTNDKNFKSCIMQYTFASFPMAVPRFIVKST